MGRDIYEYEVRYKREGDGRSMKREEWYIEGGIDEVTRIHIYIYI